MFSTLECRIRRRRKLRGWLVRHREAVDTLAQCEASLVRTKNLRPGTIEGLEQQIDQEEVLEYGVAYWARERDRYARKLKLRKRAKH